MKHCKKLTLLLIAALLLAAALMTGCTGLTPAQDAPADTKKEGIYVRLERDDAYAVYLNSDSFTKVCENADGTPLKSGEWIFAGEDIAKLSQEENRSVLRYDHMDVNSDVAKVSIVGAGMVNNPGVAATMFEALFNAGININMISTSEIKVSVLVHISDADRAVQVIHDRFYNEFGDNQ